MIAKRPAAKGLPGRAGLRKNGTADPHPSARGNDAKQVERLPRTLGSNMLLRIVVTA
jgi:hypothetical protein